MSAQDLTDDIRQFIFEHVDSVGQLDLLLYMRERREAFHDAAGLSRELRTSASSASACLALINKINLLEEKPGARGCYRYAPGSPAVDETVARLGAFYKIKPHKVLELIFSPAKRARQFADAFSLSKSNKNGDDENG